MTRTVIPVLYSAREAAKALGICERTLWAETQAGRVPHVRIRARVLYRPDALEQYVQENERSAGAKS